MGCPGQACPVPASELLLRAALNAAAMSSVSGVAASLAVPHTFTPWTPAALAQVMAHAVWLTDGQVPAHHLHGTDLLPVLRQAVGVQWNGFAGDAILGGSFAHPRYSLPGPLPPRLFAAFNRILRRADFPRVLTPEAARALARAFFLPAGSCLAIGPLESRRPRRGLTTKRNDGVASACPECLRYFPGLVAKGTVVSPTT